MAAPVFVSTTSFQSRDLGTVLSLCEVEAIDALELSALDGWDPAAILDRRFPSRFLVHNYFPPADPPFVLNLASLNPEVLSRSRAHCRAAIDLSQSLGGPVYAAHAGYTADLSPDVLGAPDRQAALPRARIAPRADAYETLVDSARKLTAYARERGVRFLIENHVLPASTGERGAELLLCAHPDELEQLAADVDEPGFGLLVDVGHLHVSATTFALAADACLDRLAPAVAALHLSDNDGTLDSHESFDEHAWFLPKLESFPDATITIELDRADVQVITEARATVAAWL